ncbi:MAG: sigma 54-interacting transcriptional regulator [Firmicutes bacterium]|nr:sigma 54-interacting transcriptional regulator [Bacillota bacterium]
MKQDQMNADSYQNSLLTAWQHFINNEEYDDSFIPAEVLDSWKRSRDAGVDPYGIIHDILSPDELNIKINNNMQFIEIVHPYMDRLYSVIKDTGSYILLADNDGIILDYVSDQDIVAVGQEKTRLVPGACRLETIAGTNAIGTALYLKKPVQLWGHEHYCEAHQRYTCSCSPIFDNDNNIIGAINITVLKEHAHPHTLGMAMSAADSISKEIKLTKAIENVERISAQRNTIIENMTSGIFLLTQTYRVSQVNQYALQMLHLSYEQTIGKNIFDIINLDHTLPSRDQHTFLKRECYNEETSVTLTDSTNPPMRFRVSVHFIKDNQQNITGTLVRFNEPELINSLVKNVSGFSAHYTFHNIIGESEPVQKMLAACKKAAQRDSNVLILGQSGTGKELIAQSIHNASPAAKGPFVAINCASIPNSLVESELFGYEKGAFTGADKNGRPGKFEMANGGTIFLDEIGDMPLNIQASLLRVIQTKEVIRIGGRYPKPINIRIIAATNQNLQQSIEDKTFRGDLYYRLNVFTINMPSLAERGPSDIRLLSEHFVHVYNQDSGETITIAPEVFPILESYSWPGNIRQLENVIERAINLTEEDGIITPSLLPEDICSFRPETAARQPAEKPQEQSPDAQAEQRQKKSLNIKENEKALIISALRENAGNVTKTAKTLEMNIRTLYRKLDKYQIVLADFRS